MPLFRPTDRDYLKTTADGKPVRLLSTDSFNSFNESLLGLGNINQRSDSIDSIAAVFDLEGFTNFSKQIEPHLSVPLFLSHFLKWIMRVLRDEMTQNKYTEGVTLWCPLPYFVKFMGDGLLLLWDSTTMTDKQRRNVIVSAHNICKAYVEDFTLTIADKVVDPPNKLRCGVARGTVYSVGDGNDFVGSCINMAARLQKLPGLPFAFNRRGFDLNSDSLFFKNEILIKKIAVRGIGDNELVGVLKAQFNALGANDKAYFRDTVG